MRFNGFLRVLICSIVCLSLFACGKSEEAKYVDELIMSIGEVTLHNEQVITIAEQAYEELDKEDAEQVECLDELRIARDKFNDLIKEEKITNVEKSIDSIGTITYKGSAEIDKAREEYEKLDDELKAKVENYNVLIEAENDVINKKVTRVEKRIEVIGVVTLYHGDKIETARKYYDECEPEIQNLISNYDKLLEAESTYLKLRADNVITLINAIGEVNLNSNSKIEKALDAYNDLTNEEKKQVDNYNELLSAKQEYNKIKSKSDKANYDKAISRCRKETDKVEGIIWYFSNRMPNYINTRSYVLPYMGKNGDYEWLCIRYNYTGDEWIFYEEIILWIDGETYVKEFDYYDIDRDNEEGDVWETIDVIIEDFDDYIEILWKIVKSEETIIRFEGAHDKYDLTIGSEDKRAIEDILTIYEYLQNY